jgi:hypothetical protein
MPAPATATDLLVQRLKSAGGTLPAPALGQTDQAMAVSLPALFRLRADGSVSLSWVCPVCGPSLVVNAASVELFCIRHGNQDDIDADPDLEDWHSVAQSPQISRADHVEHG